MNTTQLKKAAAAATSRVNKLGFTKNGAPMVIDQGYEVVAAIFGKRSQHALRATIGTGECACCAPRLALAANADLAKTSKKETSAANKAWVSLLESQGWNDTAVSSLMKDFLQEHSLWPAFVSYYAAGVNEQVLKSAPMENNMRQILEAAKASAMECYIQDLQEVWGEEHPHYTRKRWGWEASEGDTQLGYWEWVVHSIDSHGGPDEHCECGAPLDDGEGYDGLCGNCADRAENEGKFSN